MRSHNPNLGPALAALALSGMRVVAVDETIGQPGDELDPRKMTEAEQRAARDRSAVRVRPAPKAQASTHASINRNTGEPHQNKREIARRLRREQRAKGGAA